MRDAWFNLTDVSLSDEDTNPILTDANRAIQGNVAMYVTLPGGQFGINASGAI